MEYFDENGNLFEYQKIKWKKGKKTIKTFNSKHKLIRTEYEKYSVLEKCMKSIYSKKYNFIYIDL